MNLMDRTCRCNCRARLGAALLLCFAGFGGLELRAATNIYVSRDGTNNPPYSTWEDAATNIALAVGVATNGDTIWVSNGIYYLASTLTLHKGIKLRSWSGNPEDTIIDGANNYRCVYMTNTTDVLV